MLGSSSECSSAAALLCSGAVGGGTIGIAVDGVNKGGGNIVGSRYLALTLLSAEKIGMSASSTDAAAAAVDDGDGIASTVGVVGVVGAAIVHVRSVKNVSG